jgi:hypothetical protein
MGIGVSLFMIALGAVLAFAVTATFSGINIATVGLILMIVGAVGLFVELVFFMPRRRAVVTQEPAAAPYAGSSRTVVQERSTL